MSPDNDMGSDKTPPIRRPYTPTDTQRRLRCAAGRHASAAARAQHPGACRPQLDRAGVRLQRPPHATAHPRPARAQGAPPARTAASRHAAMAPAAAVRAPHAPRPRGARSLVPRITRAAGQDRLHAGPAGRTPRRPARPGAQGPQPAHGPPAPPHPPHLGGPPDVRAAGAAVKCPAMMMTLFVVLPAVHAARISWRCGAGGARPGRPRTAPAPRHACGESPPRPPVAGPRTAALFATLFALDGPGFESSPVQLGVRLRAWGWPCAGTAAAAHGRARPARPVRGTAPAGRHIPCLVMM